MTSKKWLEKRKRKGKETAISCAIWIAPYAFLMAVTPDSDPIWPSMFTIALFFAAFSILGIRIYRNPEKYPGTKELESRVEELERRLGISEEEDE